jgi:hypothetical protein
MLPGLPDPERRPTGRGGECSRAIARDNRLPGTEEPHSRRSAAAVQPGTRLVREWKGKTHEVILVEMDMSIMVRSTRTYHPLPARSPAPLVGTGLLRNHEERDQKVTMERSQTRCAIYTRKSSEEGLDQSFNSFHAQREACEAYVLSQKHEGWQIITTEYDDGGFSLRKHGTAWTQEAAGRHCGEEDRYRGGL